MVCLIMAGVAVGMIYSVQTFNDFQAVQLYRMQWLLGAIAAFAAGLLLKKVAGPEALARNSGAIDLSAKQFPRAALSKSVAASELMPAPEKF